jgi:hypothetical protein
MTNKNIFENFQIGRQGLPEALSRLLLQQPL